MRRFFLTVLIVMALPLAAFGKIVPLFNQNGTLTASVTGINLQSTLVQYSGIRGRDLGILTITTGALLSGSLSGGGSFNFVGSSYVVTVNPGVLNNFSQGGVLFSGAFTAPISWISLGSGNYELAGVVGGYWWYGQYGTGTTTQFYRGTFNSSGVFTATLGAGQSYINPEPGTLALFVSGLFGVAALAGRKLKL